MSYLTIHTRKGMTAYRAVKSWLKEQIITLKLNTPIGYALCSVIGIVLSVIACNIGLKFSIVLLGVIIGIPTVFACLFNLQFGLITMTLIAFTIQYFKKITDIPIGIALDILLVIMFFGMFIKQIQERDWSFAKSPISFWIFIWVFLNLIQAINPVAASQTAWMYTVRSMAGLILLYFIACYAFSSLQYIKLVFKILVAIAVFNALYGFYQEFRGFTNYEIAWLYAEKERFQLVFQWGRLRIFSTFGDPTTFSIYTVYMGMFCAIMLIAPIKWWKRFALAIAAIMLFWVTAYTGTRTAFVLLPAGFFFFTLMTFRKETILLAFALLLFGGVLVLKSTGNPVIYRIQSAFKPNEDPSMQLRLRNQAFIQPFIRKHPMGAGLGSTGLWGQRFTPDSFLAHFAHDSGLVRIAIELGWIGLIVYCISLFVSLKQCIYYYFRVKDPTIKMMYLAIANILFVLTLASYPQEAIVQLPTSIVFYICLAAVVRLKDFDTEMIAEKGAERVDVEEDRVYPIKVERQVEII
ncbi:MAG: O-antigen ligase family protein [Chitinophagales bacterium]